MISKHFHSLIYQCQVLELLFLSEMNPETCNFFKYSTFLKISMCFSHAQLLVQNLLHSLWRFALGKKNVFCKEIEIRKRYQTDVQQSLLGIT